MGGLLSTSPRHLPLDICPQGVTADTLTPDTKTCFLSKKVIKFFNRTFFYYLCSRNAERETASMKTTP